MNTSSEKVSQLLIAEDMELGQIIIKKFLEDCNYTLVFCKNGKEALNLYKENNFDLVLLDIEMPVMNGIETIKAIISFDPEKSNHTPFVAMTGHNKTEVYEKQIIKSGFNDIIFKPFNNIEFLQTIKQALNHGQKSHIVPKEKDTNQKAYNLELLDEFSDGVDEFKMDMLQYFVNNTPVVLKSMKRHVAEQNWENLRIEVHKYASELGFVGLQQESKLCYDMERNAFNPEKQQLGFIEIEKLETNLIRVVEQLKNDFDLS